jgi:hypothetical protein
MRKRAGALIVSPAMVPCHVTSRCRVGRAFAVGQADAARQHLLGVTMAQVVALLYDNGKQNARSRAVEKCDGADQAGLAGHMSLLDLVHAVLHLTSPPNSSPSHPDLSGVAAAATSAASACGFSSLPLAAGEKLLAGVVLSDRAMVQGGGAVFLLPCSFSGCRNSAAARSL